MQGCKSQDTSRKTQVTSNQLNLKRLFFCLGFLFFWGGAYVQAQEAVSQKPLLVRVFHSPRCKACLKTIHDIIPPVAKKYGDRLAWEYVDTTDPENYKCFLRLPREAGQAVSTPTIVIGRRIMAGMTEAADSLDKTVQEELEAAAKPLSLEQCPVDLLERFKKFGAMAVIGAGIIDGINPCAFTVIVFFVSFLSVMGYKRRETAWIGAAYAFAVFATYLVLGFGFFRALYYFKFFYLFSKIIYIVIGVLSLFLGGVAIRDYILYKKTGNTEEMALQLPAFIKKRIHSLVGSYYRKEKKDQSRTLLGLVGSALAVGFLVSLLEAVCTGQIYLPTIIFVLKEGTLRAKALFYLIAYNVMFILPLILVLVLALTGVSSQQFETYARRHLGLVKLAMAAVFLALGAFLLISL